MAESGGLRQGPGLGSAGRAASAERGSAGARERNRNDVTLMRL